jgi:DNA-binding GntR family transcriptional regulator
MRMPPKISEVSAPTDREIHNRIFDAILDRRLRPGVRLGEDRLAQLFGVSRTKIRHALATLAQDGVVQIRRNHGATVAAPTPGQVRQVFEFRRMLEPAVAAGFAASHLPEQIDALAAHVLCEDAARTAGNTAELIRLTGRFHLLLAELAGNPFVCSWLKEMEALTCLAILHYARAESFACPAHEHSQILAALTGRDGKAAARLMTRHLAHVEAELDLDAQAPVPLDLAVAFGQSAA